jgi:hypothetical protein
MDANKHESVVSPGVLPVDCNRAPLIQKDMRTIGALTSLLLFSTAALAEEVVRGQDHFQFTYRATCPEITGHADMWLPIATGDAFQAVTIQKSLLPNGWQKIEDPLR